MGKINLVKSNTGAYFVKKNSHESTFIYIYGGLKPLIKE